MKTALIYVRQSRHKDYERTVLPEVQEQTCRELAAVKRCEAVEVFTDLDVSGGKRGRRGYDAMLAHIRKGGVAVVATYDQSRAFRSTLLAAEFKALLEEQANRAIEVVFVHGTFDRSSVGGFSYAALAAAHEMEPATWPGSSVQPRRGSACPPRSSVTTPPSSKVDREAKSSSSWSWSAWASCSSTRPPITLRPAARSSAFTRHQALPCQADPRRITR